MKDELDDELEILKKQNIVSEETAQIYLSEFRKRLKSDEAAPAKINNEDKPA